MKIRSMRTRITLAFVFILAPFLFVSSHVVVYWHRAVRAEEGRRAANALIDKSVVLFRHHHAWEQGLTAFFSTQDIQDLRIGALVADLDGQVVWRSPSDVPDWPR